MKIRAAITISRDSSDTIRLRVFDNAASVEFVDARLTLEDFARALTGQAYIASVVDVRGLDVVGKVKIVEARKVLRPTKHERREEDEQWLRENCAEPGWTVNAALGSQGSRVGTEEGTLLNYSVYKHVDPTSAESEGGHAD